MLLYFPKFVEVRNPRLHVLYYFILMMACGYIISNWISARRWMREVPISDHIVTHMQVIRDDFHGSERPDAAPAGSLCLVPGMDKDSLDWVEQHSCLPLCESTLMGVDCLSSSESFSSDRQQAFFVTHLRETTVGPGGDRPPSRHYAVPSAEALFVRLSFGLRVPLGSGYNLPLGESAQYQTDTSGTTIQTVLLDSRGLPRRVIPPSDRGITLGFPELLELAGKGGWWPDRNESESWFPSTTDHGSPVAGLELMLDMKCYSEQVLDIPDHPSWGGPVCYAAVTHLLPPSWPMERSDASVNGTVRLREYGGVRLVWRTGGSVFSVDFNTIFLNVASSCVYLNFPRTIVLWIATLFLGQLSTIYWRAICEWFDIREQVAGISMRTIGTSASFVELMDAVVEEDNGSAKVVMSWMRMKERLAELFVEHRGDAFDEEELNRCVDFCYRAVVDYSDEYHVLNDLWGELQKKGRRPSKRNVFNITDGQVIDLKSFTFACCSSESIRLASLMELFDRNRRVCFLERIFTPRYLQWLEPGNDYKKFHNSNVDTSSCVFGASKHVEGGVEHVLSERFSDGFQRLDDGRPRSGFRLEDRKLLESKVLSAAQSNDDRLVLLEEGFALLKSRHNKDFHVQLDAVVSAAEARVVRKISELRLTVTRQVEELASEVEALRAMMDESQSDTASEIDPKCQVLPRVRTAAGSCAGGSRCRVGRRHVQRGARNAGGDDAGPRNLIKEQAQKPDCAATQHQVIELRSQSRDAATHASSEMIKPALARLSPRVRCHNHATHVEEVVPRPSPDGLRSAAMVEEAVGSVFDPPMRVNGRRQHGSKVPQPCLSNT